MTQLLHKFARYHDKGPFRKVPDRHKPGFLLALHRTTISSPVQVYPTIMLEGGYRKFHVEPNIKPGSANNEPKRTTRPIVNQSVQPLGQLVQGLAGPMVVRPTGGPVQLVQSNSPKVTVDLFESPYCASH